MRWTIGRRLTVIGGLSIITAVVVGGIGFQQASNASDRAADAFEVAGALSTVIDTQHTTSVILANASMLTRTVPDADRTALVEDMVEHAEELAAQVAYLDAVPVEVAGPDMPALLAACRTVLDDSEAIESSAGVLTQADFAEVRAHWDEFDEASDTVKTMLAAASAKQVEATNEAATTTRIVIAVVALLSALLLGLLVWRFARTIAGPIDATKSLLARVAAGDFTGRISTDRHDDLGEMATALNTTIERVGSALQQITAEAGALTTSSQRLTAVSSEVAAGAEQVSGEADAASRSAADVSTDVQAVATGAEQMQQSIREIARNAAEATRIVSEAVTTAEGANQTVAKLSESSTQISQVAKIIAGIAEQTNLLALNATIEAARAGELGKGFAVVAGEVKDLARETAKATEDIGHQITTIQADSAGAAAALGGISATINRIADIQQMIASAVEEQSLSTREITANVSRAADRTADIADRIVRVTDTSQAANASAGNTREAARELATTAANLHSVVSRFQLDTQGSPPI